MKLRIDNRESKRVINAFRELQRHDNDIEINVEQLDVGDVVCGNIVFERKQLGDFISSIVDGRLKSQADKMSLNFEFKYVVFVGNPFSCNSGISTRAVVGSQCSLAVRHGISFFYVEDEEQFAWCVYSTIKKHMDGRVFNPEEVKTVKFEKSVDDRVVACLMQSGIGFKRAKLLAEHVKFNLRDVFRLSVKEISALEGFGRVSAEKVKQVFKGVSDSYI